MVDWWLDGNRKWKNDVQNFKTFGELGGLLAPKTIFVGLKYF
jgi:hypothetical protein